MNEMIERVARAICESQGLDWDDQKSFMTSGGGSDDEQEGYRLAARAAIEAMREPTEEMCYTVKDDYGDPAPAHNAMTWRQMIDAILKEKV